MAPDGSLFGSEETDFKGFLDESATLSEIEEIAHHGRQLLRRKYVSRRQFRGLAPARHGPW
jgi:hypothetical protein